VIQPPKIRNKTATHARSRTKNKVAKETSGKDCQVGRQCFVASSAISLVLDARLNIRAEGSSPRVYSTVRHNTDHIEMTTSRLMTSRMIRPKARYATSPYVSELDIDGSEAIKGKNRLSSRDTRRYRCQY